MLNERTAAASSAEFCAYCDNLKTMGRCWRLTCPENGGSVRTLRLTRPGEFHRDFKRQQERLI